MTNDEIALRVWLDKTEWVQKTAQTDELGMHRADVLRKRIESRDAEIARLRSEIDRLHEGDVLYYEMPGGVRFPVGKAARGAEPFTHTEGTTYPVEVTITAVEGSDND